MAPQNNTSLSLVNTCKPQFFKVLFPDPCANIMIPRKFHMNLPHKFPKLATLFSPTKKFWHVEICRIDEDLCIQNGWSEFAKAHDLQTGYLMVFRYEGNMIFKVKIFDTAGCLKDYSLGIHATHTEACIENETSSDTRNQTSSKNSQEIKSDILKKRKLTNDQAAFDKREKGSASQTILQEKSRTETSFDSTVFSRQFEKILRPYCFAHRFLSIPKRFCVNNGLLTRRTIFVKTSSSGGMAWPVCFNLGSTHGTLAKGWKVFTEAAALKEGDRCIFRLVSENSFVVDVIPLESNSNRERKGKALKGSTSSDVSLEEKQIQQPEQSTKPVLEWESTVSRYNLTHSYQPLARTFCLDNNLTSTRDVTMRDLTGKEWRVKFYMSRTHGRLSHKGWTEFSSEYGLEEGDKCIFRLTEKDTLLVRVVKKEECEVQYF